MKWKQAILESIDTLPIAVMTGLGIAAGYNFAESDHHYDSDKYEGKAILFLGLAIAIWAVHGWVDRTVKKEVTSSHHRSEAIKPCPSCGS